MSTKKTQPKKPVVKKAAKKKSTPKATMGEWHQTGEFRHPSFPDSVIKTYDVEVNAETHSNVVDVLVKERDALKEKLRQYETPTPINYVGLHSPSPVSESPKLEQFIGAMDKELSRLMDSAYRLQGAINRTESLPTPQNKAEEDVKPYDHLSYLRFIETRLCTLNNKFESLTAQLNSIL